MSLLSLGGLKKKIERKVAYGTRVKKQILTDMGFQCSLSNIQEVF